MIDQLDLTDIYRTLYSITAEETFFPLEIFTNIYHVLSHKANLKKIKIIQIYKMSY